MSRTTVETLQDLAQKALTSAISKDVDKYAEIAKWRRVFKIAKCVWRLEAGTTLRFPSCERILTDHLPANKTCNLETVFSHLAPCCQFRLGHI